MPTTKTHEAAFPQDFFHDACVLTAAKTTYSDGTNAVQLSVAGAQGSEYAHIAFTPRATWLATQLQLYASDGTSYFLLSTALTGAGPVSTTVAIPTYPLYHIDGTIISESNPLRLQAGWKLYAGISVALTGGWVCNAQRRDY